MNGIISGLMGWLPVAISVALRRWDVTGWRRRIIRVWPVSLRWEILGRHRWSLSWGNTVRLIRRSRPRTIAVGSKPFKEI